jgi:hypothetical protein
MFITLSWNYFKRFLIIWQNSFMQRSQFVTFSMGKNIINIVYIKKSNFSVEFFLFIHHSALVLFSRFNIKQQPQMVPRKIMLPSYDS